MPLNSKRGSISIFAVIIIPTLLVGMFAIYSLLHQAKIKTDTETVAAQSSDVRLNTYSSTLYDDYNLLAYEESDQLETIMQDMYALNRFDALYTYNIEVKALSEPMYFFDGVNKASRASAVNQCIAMTTSWLGIEATQSGITDKFDAVQKLKEDVFDALAIDKLKKKFEQFKNWTDAEDLNGLIDELEQRLSQSTILLDEGMKAIEAMDLSDVLTDVNLQSTLGESSLEDGDDSFAEDLEGTLDNFKVYLEAMTAISDELTAKVEDVENLQDEKESLKEDLKEVKDDIDDVKAAIASGGAGNTQSKLDRLYTRRDRINDALDENEAELEALGDTIKESVDGFVETYMPEKPPLYEKLVGIADDITAIADALGGNDKEDEAELKTLEEAITAYDDLGITIDQHLLIDEYYLGVLKSYDLDSVRNFDYTGMKYERETKYDGEVEYILSGHDNDTLNFMSAKAKILAMRTVSNTGVLLMSSEARSAVISLTAPIPPPFNFVIDGLILSAWGSAEGYMDVADLVDGKGVAFIKPFKSFKFGLGIFENGATSALKTTGEKMLGRTFESAGRKLTNADKQAKLKANLEKQRNPSVYLDTNLYYQDYLRLLLAIQSPSKSLARFNDLLNDNLEGTLSNYAIGQNITLNYNQKPYFILERVYE